MGEDVYTKRSACKANSHDQQAFALGGYNGGVVRRCRATTAGYREIGVLESEHYHTLRLAR